MTITLYCSHELNRNIVKPARRVYIVPGDVQGAFDAFDAGTPGALIMAPAGWTGNIVLDYEDYTTPTSGWRSRIELIRDRWPKASIGVYGWPQPQTIAQLSADAQQYLNSATNIQCPSFYLDAHDISWMASFVALIKPRRAIPFVTNRFTTGSRYLQALSTDDIALQVNEMARLGVIQANLWLNGIKDYMTYTLQPQNDETRQASARAYAGLIHSTDQIPQLHIIEAETAVSNYTRAIRNAAA